MSVVTTELAMRRGAASPARAGVPDPTPQVFRPVQYLGCKLRSLTPIVAAHERLVPPPSHALDLFTGTSVVAQALAGRSYGVTAVDAMGYSAMFARATLGVGRTQHADADDVGELAELVRRSAAPDWWRPWIADALREGEATAAGDGEALLRQAVELPQVWRAHGVSDERLQQFEGIVRSEGLQVPATLGVVTTHYAGTYFGVRQALEIDRMRAAIADLVETGVIDQWLEAVLLTALMSAASTCAFSAGKHFAQPHRIRDGKDLTFLRRRVVEDRSLDVCALFAARVEELLSAARPADEDHDVRQVPVEELDTAGLRAVDVIYADPPYTAQQYSRFYHVLEVLVQHRVPRLQRVRGEITRGLYPEGKYLSRFCSRREAGAAFATLFSLANQLSASLILSYSASRTGSTGNERMISLSELRRACAQHFPANKVHVVELEHSYRQFNSAASAVADRADGEYLVVCGAQ